MRPGPSWLAAAALACLGLGGAGGLHAEEDEPARSRSLVWALQDWGLPPVLYWLDPSKAAEEQAMAALYSLDPAAPTEEGQLLLEVLEAAGPRAAMKVTHRKLGLLLYAISKYLSAKQEAKPEAVVFHYRAALDEIMALPVRGEPDCLMSPANPECAGLGKSGRSMREVLAERQRALVEALEALEKSGAVGSSEKAAFLRRVHGEMATLRLDPGGKPLVPSTLEWIVKELPEEAMREDHWRVLFESYPMGKSLWALRADRLWRNKINGRGVTVAVLDAGLDKDHPFLAGRAEDLANHTSEPDARGSHGTHVAGTIAAIAPGARIVSVKTIEKEGEPWFSMSKNDQGYQATRQGLETVWTHNREVAEGRKKAPRIDIVSMSLGFEPARDMLDPAQAKTMSLWVRKLVGQGVLVVASAGNSGPSAQPLRTPGALAETLTVGAVDYFRRVAGFSSHQRVLELSSGRVVAKPDVFSYGRQVVSANLTASGPSDLSRPDSGTSMAAPHVAGMAALLIQAARRHGATLLPGQIKEIFSSGGQSPVNGNQYLWGPVADLGQAYERLRRFWLKGAEPLR